MIYDMYMVTFYDIINVKFVHDLYDLYRDHISS